jgi:hypothetical protein
VPRGKKAVDLTGQRFVRLVARERAADRIYSGRPFTAWRCDCDCGGSSVATVSGLTRGLTKSCGCLRSESGKFKTLDITGQRYGRLTVVKRVGSRNGKALWSCDCDCGARGHETTQNQLQRGHAQSCGCLCEEFLNLGIRKAMMPMFRPKAVKITYPVPENLHPNPFVNEVMRRMMQFKWERVEFEARQIERGKWKEPEHIPFIPVDESGNRIKKIDLRALARVKKSEVRAQQARVQVPEVPASYCVGSSLADRVRVLTPEEWDRLASHK